jgi:hypothetical protein
VSLRNLEEMKENRTLFFESIVVIQCELRRVEERRGLQ